MKATSFLLVTLVAMLSQEVTSQDVTSLSSDKDGCRNKANWCEVADPNCEMEYTQEHCRKYCNLCETDCTFEAILPQECPSDPHLPECSLNMTSGELCEANRPLPDGNVNYQIDNCDEYDVYRCTRGGCMDTLPSAMTQKSSCKKIAITCPKLENKCDTMLGVAIGNSKLAKSCKRSLRGDANKLVEEFCTKTCMTCIHGNWGSWSSYGQCSQKRTRACDNPVPSGGGYFCYGNSEENSACNNATCSDDVCRNEATWCKAADADCSNEFVQRRCRKFCNLCDTDTEETSSVSTTSFQTSPVTTSIKDLSTTPTEHQPNTTTEAVDLKCGVNFAIRDDGYSDAYRGWYDTRGCGTCQDYCRWVGAVQLIGSVCGSGGNPSSRTKGIWWACQYPDHVYKYLPSFPFKKCSGRGSVPPE